MANVRISEWLVEKGLRRVESETEADYSDAWIDHALPLGSDLLAMAVAGGMVADRLAWVFVAGYQAACRHAFPSAELRSWVSYAASEDREGDPPLPGVNLTRTPSAATLSGHKTWVAAARHVEQLVVKVGAGSEATYFLVDRGRPGLTIDPAARDFLSGLSQGRASFEDTPVTGADALDATHIGQLALVEPLYIYSAFCGFVLGSTTEQDLVACSHDCLDAVEPAIASIRAGDLDRVNQQKAEARALDLLVRLTGNRLQAAGNWETDQKIIAMYSGEADVDVPH